MTGLLLRLWELFLIISIEASGDMSVGEKLEDLRGTVKGGFDKSKAVPSLPASGNVSS